MLVGRKDGGTAKEQARNGYPRMPRRNWSGRGTQVSSIGAERCARAAQMASRMPVRTRANSSSWCCPTSASGIFPRGSSRSDPDGQRFELVSDWFAACHLPSGSPKRSVGNASGFEMVRDWFTGGDMLGAEDSATGRRLGRLDVARESQRFPASARATPGSSRSGIGWGNLGCCFSSGSPKRERGKYARHSDFLRTTINQTEGIRTVSATGRIATRERRGHGTRVSMSRGRRPVTPSISAYRRRP